MQKKMHLNKKQKRQTVGRFWGLAADRLTLVIRANTFGLGVLCFFFFICQIVAIWLSALQLLQLPTFFCITYGIACICILSLCGRFSSFQFETHFFRVVFTTATTTPLQHLAVHKNEAQHEQNGI